MAIPLRIESLDCTVFEGDRKGSAFVSIGEHFRATKGDRAGQWLPGQRSFTVEITDSRARRLLIAYLNRVGKVMEAALEEYPVQEARVAQSSVRASWVDELDDEPAPRAKPAPAPAPTPDPAASDLLKTLGGKR